MSPEATRPESPQFTEAARLRALHHYQILDTPPEKSFDRITQLAASIFQTPIALVSLVDEQRQWFKSCYGLNLRETDRSLSFCAHALELDGVLVVPDAHADPRFAHNLLVTSEPYLRFYAGAPLISPDGHKLGTLCILDTQARAGLTPEECQTLQHLAASVVSELELRQTLTTLARRESVHAAVLQASLDAIIVMDHRGQITEWNPAAERLFGYQRSEVLGQNLSDHIIPEGQRAAHRRGLTHYLQTGEGPFLGKRLHLSALRRDGQVFPCELSVHALEVPGERLFTASLRDLTELRTAQDALETSHQLLQTVIDTVPETIFVKDLARRYTMINPAGAAQLGRTAAEILGRSDEELFPEIAATAARLRDEQVLTQARALSYEVTDQLSSGAYRTFLSKKMPAWGHDGQLNGLIGVAIDITERKVTETTVRNHNAALTARAQAAQLEVLDRLTRAAEYRDDETGEHMLRVARTAAGIARELGLSEGQVQLIERTAPMHDIGKIGVPDGILLKPGRLTAEEFETVKTHCLIGSNILSGGQSPLVVMAEEIARTHHERWDGSGYPHGLSGDAIPISGRIVAVADVLDALTTVRPYKRAWPLDEALAEIRMQTGRHFDPQVVAALERVIGRPRQIARNPLTLQAAPQP
ncbi:PAS domain S-box protein [Deinococcus humi]|uniref:Putative two-component system response regulator n=1 Tax=Deinococcus humi TaxID=662880 RepID=A0A7W8NFD8_9DEIO|nr:putative two-component system response regulator [Deinococcus humi]